MDKPVQRNIVVSAVNIRKGGTLTVLRDCLRYLSSRSDVKVTAIVHRRQLCEYPGVTYIEIPWSSKGWGRRLWCEYVTLNRISRRLNETDLWFSLHDTTPKVQAKRQAVYCHTSFPFLETKLQDWRMDAKIPLFAHFTKYAYRWNVHKNRYLVVQTQWMRDGLSQLVDFPKERIVVAPPAFSSPAVPEKNNHNAVPLFFYPSTADCHKNFETVCQAAEILEKKIGKQKFRLILTISGEENAYAHWLKGRFAHLSSIVFYGFMSREELYKFYADSVCLLFPSRVETWGLPISEFLPSGKPMLLADLPYAHETASGAPYAQFVPYDSPEAFAEGMWQVIQGNYKYFSPVSITKPEAPYAQTWDELFKLLMA